MRLVTTGLDDVPDLLDDDCWLHVGVPARELAEGGATVRRVLQRGDAVSVAVRSETGDGADPADLLPALEELLQDCGREGAVVFLAEPLLRPWDEDGEAGTTELATALAESSGVVLLVVLSEREIIAVKPDGRTEAVERPATGFQPDDAFCAAFLTRYIDDPSDLRAAMASGGATQA